jgi:hypothetical protein
MSETTLPVALIDNTFLLVSIGSLAMSEAVNNVALVEAVVRPIVSACACDLIVFEFTFVLGTINPDEFSLAMKQSESELSLESMAFSKLTCALSVVDFAYLKQG